MNYRGNFGEEKEITSSVVSWTLLFIPRVPRFPIGLEHEITRGNKEINCIPAEPDLCLIFKSRALEKQLEGVLERGRRVMFLTRHFHLTLILRIFPVIFRGATNSLFGFSAKFLSDICGANFLLCLSRMRGATKWTQVSDETSANFFANPRAAYLTV